MRRRLIAALLAAALLAAPAAALAQSAGDEQYADPFGEVKDPSQENSGSNGSGTPDTDTTVAAPAAGADDVAGSDSSSGSATLPHTGFPAALTAMLGALLLTIGASVWRRAQPPLALPPWLTPGASRRASFGVRRRRRR
jgi:hypothetical protein